MPSGLSGSGIGSPAAVLCTNCTPPNFVDRNDSLCVSTCVYQNASIINTTSFTICEAANTTTCPTWKRLGSGTFSCMSACSDAILKYNFNNLCVATCRNETSKFLSGDGSSCVSACQYGYVINGSQLQCLNSSSQCLWPNALYIAPSQDATNKYCSTLCPSGTYLNRADQNCVSSCSYRNASQTSGNNVCETPANATNCPFLVYS